MAVLLPAHSCHGNLAAAGFSRRFFDLHVFPQVRIAVNGATVITIEHDPGPSRCAKGNALNDWNKDSKRRREFGLLGRAGGLTRFIGVLVLGSVFLSAPGTSLARSPASEKAGVVRTADLPKEAQETLALIRQGGPFPHARDGAVFANREGRLPPAARGTYREYTVKTPGSRDRGARRIIAAGNDQFWYTADHYRSFTRIIE